jgi:DtxR family Mn-dependent transcriptional regulator
VSDRSANALASYGKDGDLVYQGTGADATMANRIKSRTAAIEDYLKTIYQLGTASSDGTIHTTCIASAIGLTPGTVTAMLRRLASYGYIQYERYRGVRLTETGRDLGRQILHRHRVLMKFLSAVLGTNEDESRLAAERLEHVVSAKTVHRMEAALDSLVSSRAF